MFSGIREQISPTILAVATLLTLFSMALLFSLELLRRRNERLRGIQEKPEPAEIRPDLPHDTVDDPIDCAR